MGKMKISKFRVRAAGALITAVIVLATSGMTVYAQEAEPPIGGTPETAIETVTETPEPEAEELTGTEEEPAEETEGTAEEIPEAEEAAPLKAAPLMKLGASPSTGSFWVDPNYGDGDLLYYGSIGGATRPAYCIDHGKGVPSGTYSVIPSYVSNQIGYIMKNGYPNTNWGLPNSEAQYLTQVAVFAVLGVPLYEWSDGIAPQNYVYNAVWGNGHFYIAENLAANAAAHATAADARYASYWNPSDSWRQRVVTPNPTCSLTVTKTTSATGECLEGITGNDMYSQDFSGAGFGVEYYDSSTASWKKVGDYVTGGNGNFTVSTLVVGDKIRVTETKAPMGYVIPKEASKTITLAAGNNSLTFEDDPTFDPGTPVIYKSKYLNGEIIKGEPVGGAVFMVEYFDNTGCEGEPVRTWYFMTDDEGTFEYTPTWLAQGYESDELYVDKNGLYDMPLGSVRMTEVESPAGYLRFEGNMYGTITQDEETGLAEFAWGEMEEAQLEVQGGSILVGEKELVAAVEKVDSVTGYPVKGALMQLIEDDRILAQWTTDGTAHELKNLLVAGHTYRVHEKTPPEHYCRTEDVIFSIDEEGRFSVENRYVDMYYTYENYLVIRMKDTRIPDPPVDHPRTGDDNNTTFYIILLGSALTALGGSAVYICRRKKKH